MGGWTDRRDAMPQTQIAHDAQSQDLLAAEKRFDAALLSSNVAALNTILAERFFLNDFMGGVVPRAGLLEYLKSGALKFHAIVPHDVAAQHYGELGLVTGWTEMKAELQGAVSEVRSRFLHVYVKEAGAWRMAAAQGTVIPELD